MSRGRVAIIAVILAGAPAAARAQFPDITDRDYTIDLHQGAVIGSGQIIGMGGAGVTTGEGSAGSLFNPAAAAARPATADAFWEWSFHVDILSTNLGSDFDNNGIKQTDEYGFFSGPVATGGLGIQRGCWGLAISGFVADQRLDQRPDGSRVIPRAWVVHFALARAFLDYQLIAGVGVRAGTFQMLLDPESGRGTDLFSITGSSLESGAEWRPRDRDLRVGVSGMLPVSSDKVDAEECDPLDCEGFILPERAALPWQVSVGAAWRFARTPWNKFVRQKFLDEKYVIVAADLVVTGKVRDGHGIEAFADGQLQKSGRHTSVSPRLGAEYEWVPGRFRIRGGSYWEPSRFRGPSGEDIPGRAHLTAGLDWRVWSFCAYGWCDRVRLSLTSDAAERYGNGGLSIGLWR